MGIRGKTSIGVATAGLVGVLALAGCAPGGEGPSGDRSALPSGSTPSSPAVSSSPAAETTASAPAAVAPLAVVSGSYRNGDWAVRLSADGTWEEDFGGRVNAYGGTYSVQDDRIILQDRGGSSETATLSGDELRLPSVTLRRE